MNESIKPSPKARILVIDDELPMRRALEDCLTRIGYRVLSAADGEAGLERALKEDPDLLLMDVMMPGLSGFELCAALRRGGAGMPILMLTAKGEVSDRVTGLDSGADDYLVKPFSTEELLARVRALLRRKQSGDASVKLDLGNVKIDLARLEASREGKPLTLTTREFAILRLLALADGAPVSREQFLDQIWGYTSFPTTRTVDTHVLQLRKKIEPCPESPRWILTVHGVGYRLNRSEGLTTS